VVHGRGIGSSEEVVVGTLWVGIDAGKDFHWASGIDGEGQVIMSRRVENDETDIIRLIEEARGAATEVVWAVDIPGGVAALTLAVLWARDERVVYLPGIAVDRSRDAYRGEAKTDARDARIIAQQARTRHDLTALRPSQEVLAELAVLTSRRRDLVQDQTRAITRLRAALVGVFPGLERSLDLRTKGALLLVRRYRTPAEVRRAGRRRIEAYLRTQGAKGAVQLAERALEAAGAQSVRLPAEEVSAAIVTDLVGEVLSIKDRLVRLDEALEQRFFSHPQAEILISLPGLGPRLGAEFLVAVGDLSSFDSADHLAAYAGLVPVARDSGKRTGNLRRMHGGNKVLKLVFYQSAFASLRSAHSRAFYDRKRVEGKRHHQAVIALARRRVNVLWAMLRDETMFKPLAA
jgi:transposase